MTKNIEFDRANFPMIWVESLKAHIHWLPVTKIQFEYFIWDTSNPSFDQAWLDRMYKYNRRVTPNKIAPSNYWQAFMTGIAPVEVEQFASWCGDGPEEADYSIPTADEWQQAYKEMQGRKWETFEKWDEWNETALKRSSERAKTLFKKMAEMPASKKNLADLMLFNGGVLEWLRNSDSTKTNIEYTGHGETNRYWENASTGNYLRHAFPVKSIPKSPEDDNGRAAYYGFRLLRREKA